LAVCGNDFTINQKAKAETVAVKRNSKGEPMTTTELNRFRADRNLEEVQGQAATSTVAVPDDRSYYMQGSLRAPRRRIKMPKLTLLDPTKTGKQAEDL
jgi:hypothetical protein